MRPLARLGFAMVLAGATALVSGCDSLDSLQLFETKTKLPGERKPVFPEGVPGVTPGVPPEMMKGYKEPAADAAPPPIPGEQKAAEEKPKPKPHAVQTAAKPPAAAKPPPAVAKPQPAPTVAAQASAPPPAPPPGSAPLPWPGQQQQQPQPQAAWPSAPSSGTIAR
jgi:hypothetical protein